MSLINRVWNDTTARTVIAILIVSTLAMAVAYILSLGGVTIGSMEDGVPTE